MMQLLTYLNPIAQLGNRSYSILFPLFLTLSTVVALEFYAYNIVRNPDAIGLFAIFFFVALIIYFSFRDGIIGGLLTTVITISYYFYIIYTRGYTGERFTSGVETTIVLGILYLFLSGTIGWLKQTIDKLIEREANEKRRLRAIVEQLPVGVLITDAKGRLELTNKQLDKIIGTKLPPGFQIGKDTINNKINGKPINPSESPLANALAHGKPIVGKEFLFEKVPGKHLHIQVSSSPIHNTQGKIIAAASIISDITQQKELEERKDDFVNMASHELKTPITSMKLYLESLLKRIESYNDPRAVKTLGSIKYQTERLQELVSDLIDVSRLQTGKLTFTKEKFDLVALIRETLEHLQGSASQEITFSYKTPLMIYADKFRMYQVLANLLTNACKYSPADSEITIAIKKAADKVMVSIKDKGIGISKEHQKKIFERLYQVTDSNEKTFPGFGMGLYITKEIIKRHRGNIWVESEKGKGSTFYITLPLTK